MNNNMMNLVAAVILSVAIIFGWQYFFEKPRLKDLQKNTKEYQNNIDQKKEKAKKEIEFLDRNKALVSDNRISIVSDAISGSISLKGARFDDITLLKYKKTLDDDSPPVELLSPSNSKNAYFAELGWSSSKLGNVTCPNASTIWSSDSNVLKAGESINLYWTSPEQVKFRIEISLDKEYLFTTKQYVYNSSDRPISVKNYGLINRIYDGIEFAEDGAKQAAYILHRGMIGAMNDELQEYTYDKMKDKKRQVFSNTKINWLGITDKYWLSAIIPDSSINYNASYNYAVKSGHHKYQSDFISQANIIEPGQSIELLNRLFFGPKKVNLLDNYEKIHNIKLFDRAIDFGWFYILTKPIFHAMNYFYKYVGNFGISIMIVTIIVKLLMFTLTNKSYKSMKKMKELQPEMERLKELYSEDKERLNKEVMALYKREKVNPISGCLPILLQIPVFFSVYKVLYVTIEMRHAPFYGWIQDLSAPDPTSFINLFGLLPFSAPAFLMVGAWPIIMAITMFLQQRMTPAPSDPVQAQVMKFLPLVFLFVFASFPAGLLIYWSWNNILSIVQQSYVNSTKDK